MLVVGPQRAHLVGLLGTHAKVLDVERVYRTVTDEAELTSIARTIRKQGLFSVDLETTSKHAVLANIVGVAVAWYGVIPWPDAQPDWSAVEGTIVAHIAENDDFFGPEAAAQLEATLDQLSKDATFHVYAGAEHAFFNDTRPEVYHADHAQLAWDRTIEALGALR